MFESADKILQIAQYRYKANINTTVRLLQVFHAGDEVFDRPPGERTTAENIADMTHSKIPQKANGPYRVIIENEDMVTVDQKGLHNTEKTEKVSLAQPRYDTDVACKTTGTFRLKTSESTKEYASAPSTDGDASAVEVEAAIYNAPTSQDAPVASNGGDTVELDMEAAIEDPRSPENA